MFWKKFHAAIILVFALSVAASASLTEIRQNFFNQTANLAATPIMTAPTADASYLIAIYESVGSAAATPTLRWTDENAVPQSQTGVFASLGLLASLVVVYAAVVGLVLVARRSV